MRFDNDKDSKIRITEDGNGLFHVERNCYLISSKQSIWPWKPVRYEEHWSTLPIAKKGPFDSFGEAVRIAKEYIGAIRSKIVLEATFSSILDGTAFGGEGGAK